MDERFYTEHKEVIITTSHIYCAKIKFIKSNFVNYT